MTNELRYGPAKYHDGHGWKVWLCDYHTGANALPGKWLEQTHLVLADIPTRIPSQSGDDPRQGRLL